MGLRRRQSDCCQTKSGGRRRLRNHKTRVTGICSEPARFFPRIFSAGTGASRRALFEQGKPSHSERTFVMPSLKTPIAENADGTERQVKLGATRARAGSKDRD